MHRVALLIIGLAMWAGLPLHRAQSALLGSRLAAQTPGVTMKIVSPGEDAYVSGPVMLRVLFFPSSSVDRVEAVTFFVDGRVACRLTQAPFECSWDTGTGIDEHAVRAVAVLRNAERLVENVRTKVAEFAERVDVNVVQVTASVTDGRGKFVSQLSSDAFRLFEDNIPQRITYFTAEHTPLEVVVAVDVSGSMTNAMPTVKSSVKRFLSTLREGDKVTLLAFNENVFTLARRETTAVGRSRAVDRLKAWGGTALFDAIVRALDLLGRHQGRRALVVFTDGEDQSSHALIDQVVRKVESSDATLYIIAAGRGLEVDSLMQVQERLTRVSGGRAFQTTAPEELDETFEQILTELSNQYVLAYPPTNAKLDDSWREIRVEMANGDYRVRARQGYRATAVGRSIQP